MECSGSIGNQYAKRNVVLLKAVGYLALCGSQELILRYKKKKKKLLQQIDMRDRWNGWTKGKPFMQKTKKVQSETSSYFWHLSLHLWCTRAHLQCWVSCLMQLQAQNHAVPQLPPQIISTLRDQRIQVTAGWPFSFPKCLEEPSIGLPADRCSQEMEHFQVAGRGVGFTHREIIVAKLS